MNKHPKQKWIDLLDEEDLGFIRRFVLASGSLKDLAGMYGISYPTIRLRLDRLIAKIKVIESQEIVSEFERLVRALCADGKIDAATMSALLTAHETEKGGRHENVESTD